MWPKGAGTQWKAREVPWEQVRLSPRPDSRLGIPLGTHASHGFLALLAVQWLKNSNVTPGYTMKLCWRHSPCHYLPSGTDFFKVWEVGKLKQERKICFGWILCFVLFCWVSPKSCFFPSPPPAFFLFNSWINICQKKKKKAMGMGCGWRIIFVGIHCFQKYIPKASNIHAPFIPGICIEFTDYVNTCL